MSRMLCVAVVLSASLLSWAGPASAGMSEGVAAVTVGDYEKAIAEFQPLAAAGDPAAQYQLARIYLEGRGPADGVPQGIALMNKAADGGYPEAQAQLGLMYAMGLGVDVDNVQAYDWLTKAVTALPAGTRRTVAEANRDAVMKRMTAAEQTQVAASTAKPAAMPAAAKTATTASKPAATQEAANKSAAQETTAKTTAAKATSAGAATAKATTAKATTAAATTTKAPTTKTTTAAATTTKTVTEAAAANKTKTTGTATAGTTGTATTAAKATATAAKPTSGEAKTADKPAQVASAKAADAAPSPADNAAAQKTAPSGVRIQLISMPSEEAAWAAWKQLSGKYSSHLTGLTAMVEPADLGDKGKFYRVQTGPFTTVAAAQERCTAMKEAGLDCLVVGKP